MNVVRAFADYLQTSGVATLGQDLFISRAPSSNTSNSTGVAIPQNIWWLVAAGGSRLGKFDVSTINVFYRDRDTENVYEELQALRDEITCAGCVELDGYQVIRVVTSGFWADQDIDNEERTVGLLPVSVTTYPACVPSLVS